HVDSTRVVRFLEAFQRVRESGMRPQVRMSRYLDGIHQYRRGRMGCVEAAEMLGIGERHFRRLRKTCAAEGVDGLVDRRRGRKSGRRPREVTELVWVEKDALLLLHSEALARFGGVDGIRDEGLLGSALARPRNALCHGGCGCAGGELDLRE
ncbi:MAG: helix-turn-helix domain-containing protein, partial [Alphaproteobacteria bacterium]|nr:helix-turn-helix domain-containing protein [Alphaproteobacteria bacterium]